MITVPTVLRQKGYRFYFFAREGNEPPHVHIDKDGGAVKIWLHNISVARAENLKPFDVREALKIAHTHHKLLTDAWYEFAQRKS